MQLSCLNTCQHTVDAAPFVSGCRRTLNHCRRFKDGVTKACENLRRWKVANMHQAARSRVRRAGQQAAGTCMQ